MKLIIKGNPVAQGRPKFTTVSGYARAYDPKKSKDWKKEIIKQANQMNAAIQYGPLLLIAHFFIFRTKSIPKKRIFPDVRPDLDNYLKCIKDGLNEICWEDDSKVVQIFTSKNYTYDEARIEIEILPAMELSFDGITEIQRSLYNG